MHPGCSKLLFALPAFPRPPAPDTDLRPSYDVDQRLILDACRVITNDATTSAHIGYLSNDRAGHDRIPFPSADADADSDALLPGKYFYHPRPPSATTSTIPNYPIVTDFVAWQFPEKIPDHWVRPKPSPEEMAELWRKYAGCRQKDMESAVTADDETCILTGGFSNAPSSSSPRALLGFESPARVLLPKAVVSGGPGRSASELVGDGATFVHVAVVCKPRYKDYVELEGLHCMPVVLSRRVSDAFLYARFANANISLVKRDPAFEVFPLPEGVRPSRREVAPKALPPEGDGDHDSERC
ncbi:hypothetical protein V8D89_012822 [Ganoderma adspersum]